MTTPPNGSANNSSRNKVKTRQTGAPLPRPGPESGGRVRLRNVGTRLHPPLTRHNPVLFTPVVTPLDWMDLVKGPLSGMAVAAGIPSAGPSFRFSGSGA